MIAQNPLHGSGRAALALGDNAHAPQRIGMTDNRKRQPASDQAPHAVPEDAAILAAPRQRAMPEASHLEPEKIQRRLVPGHSVIPEVPTHHRLQPFTLFGNGFVHPALKFGFHRVQLRLQPLADRLPQHREPPITFLLHTDMCKAQKVERLRFPFSTPPPLVDCERTKFQQPRFLRMQFQVELPHSFRASASRRKVLTRLNTRPARSPVNASTPLLRVAPHDSGPMWVGRVRWWRGSGLRMMPTFPPPPLSFRTASFPQYGWKVGLSGSAFPHVAQVKPAPGIPCASRRFASALSAPRCSTLRPALCRNSGTGSALPCEELSPLPQRPSLRSGFYCPSPSTLSRPHPSHSQAHPAFAAWRFIRDAFAVLVRLGDPRVVPCFRCAFLFGMPPSTTAGSPLVACAQFLHQRCGPSPDVERFGTPKFPHHPLPMGRIFAASLVRYALRPVELLASLADPTGCLFRPSETFTPGLSSSRSPFSPPGITTVVTERFPPMGLSPIGTTASIAAPTSHSYDFCIHYTSPV